jgi:excisionase family DNA binding protein
LILTIDIPQLDTLIAEQKVLIEELREQSGFRGDNILTIQGVAEKYKVSEAKIYELVRTRSIPGRKVAGQWRFSERSLDDWFSGSGGSSED